MGYLNKLPKKKSSTFFNPPLKKCRRIEALVACYVSRTNRNKNFTKKPKGQSLDSNPRVHAKFQVELDSPCRSQGKNPKQKPQCGWVVFCSEFRQRHRVSPGYIFQDVGYNICSSWWFQPLWKILVKLDHVPKLGMKIKKYFKPPPRCCLFCCFFRSRV